MKRHIFFAIMISFLLSIIPSSGFAQSKVGTTAAPFLGISVTPRATAMGGAFAGMSDDASALYYNPGAISRLSKSEFTVSHTEWLVNTDFNWLGLVLKFDEDDAIGLQFTQLNYGDERVTTVEQPEGTEESWNAADLAIGLSYARNLTDRFSIGSTVKYIQQRVWHESSSAWAADIGLQFTTDFHGMRMGMSIANFGTDIRMDGEDLLHRIDLSSKYMGHNETIVGNLKTDSWPLPLFFRVGLAMEIWQSKLIQVTTAADAIVPSDNSEVVNLGAELAYSRFIFLRAGYKSLFREESQEGLTLGFGLQLLSSGSIAWNIDYGYADFGLFEDVHMFALGIRF